MKYGFIARQRAIWPTRVLCRMLGVSHGGFYDWLNRAPSARSRDNERVTGRIRASFAESDRTYGSPRVWRDLQDSGERCSENRVARLMRFAGLQARAKRRRPPQDAGARTEHYIAANVLNRQFGAPAPNQHWVADFTYGTPSQRSPPGWGPSCLSTFGMHRSSELFASAQCVAGKEQRRSKCSRTCGPVNEEATSLLSG